MALEERFLGKTFEEVRPWIVSGPLDPERERVHNEAYEYIDDLDPEAAALRQLFEATWTPERLDRFEEKLLRHMVTAERTQRLGPARPLLGGVASLCLARTRARRRPRPRRVRPPAGPPTTPT